MVTLPLTVLAVGFGALAAAPIVASVQRGTDRRVALQRSLAVLVALAAVGLVGMVALVAVGRMRMYGVVHYAYLVGTVSTPMVGVVAAFASWRAGGATVPRVLVVALLVPAPVGFYATHIEPHWLRVDQVTVRLDPARAGDDPITIGVLADLQTNRVGDHEREAVAALMAAAPDVILLPGDLFHGSDAEFARELDAMRELLGRLEAPHGVYFTPGDAETPRWTERMLEGTSIQVFERDVVDLEIGDRRLRIGGHSLHPSAHDSDVVRTDLDGTSDDGVITVLFGHRPDTVLHLRPDSRVDLTVAGHTHGGQIVVPGFGPLVTLSDVPRDVARGGLHRVDGNQIYVSPGVGIERGDAPQVRLFNRPAVAVLTLV